MYRIFYTEEAKDQIDEFNEKLKIRFKKAIERIAENPAIGKKLTHEFSGLQSYHTGDYRIIYRTYHRQVLILMLVIGHRRDIYKRIARKR